MVDWRTDVVYSSGDTTRRKNVLDSIHSPVAVLARLDNNFGCFKGGKIYALFQENCVGELDAGKDHHDEKWKANSGFNRSDSTAQIVVELLPQILDAPGWYGEITAHFDGTLSCSLIGRS